jgi:hypothetical protein
MKAIEQDIQSYLKAFGKALTQVTKFVPEFGLIVLSVVLAALLVKALLRLLEWRKNIRQEYIFIEITPPATSLKTPLATQELYEVLHGIGSRRKFRDRLTKGNMTLTYALCADKHHGVRYIMRVPASGAKTIQNSIISYLPDVKTRTVDDYMPKQLAQKWVRVVEFRQQKPYPFPLKEAISFSDHDLGSYITNAMSKLANNELIVFQVVATPVIIRDAEVVVDKLLRNEDLLSHLSKNKHAVGLQRATSGFVFLLSRIAGLADELLFSSSDTYSAATSDQRNRQEIALRHKPARSISPLEQELHDSMHHKVKQPKYRVEIRALIAVDDKQELKQRISALDANMGALSTEYQSLTMRHNFAYDLRHRLRLFKFDHRLPSLFRRHSAILAASEIASIYHFPASAAATSDLEASYSRTLGVTASRRRSETFDAIIGENTHHGETSLIGITAQERERHTYIIGGTGNGKTTEAESLIIQDIRKGRGVGFIDPHGDAAKKLLRFIPEERIKDVVYFHPDDIDFPVGLNLIEIDPTLTGSERVKLEIKIVNLVVEALRRSFSDDATGGHRIEAMLRNGLQTAMTVDGATIFTILKLIRNETFRKNVVNKLDDERLIDFWNGEFDKAGDMQRVSMAKGLTLKLDRFQGDPAVGRILGQSKSTISFADIIDNKKILICDLSKGEIGSDNATLLGTLVLTFIQIAAEQRARMEQSERVPFYLYVDEFQNFATKSFTDMANEARKYGILLTIIEQTTSQIEDKQLLGQILANVGTLITFRTGNPADEQALLPFFGQSLSPGEINSLPAYNFYARINSQKSLPPLSGQTIPLDGKGDKDIAERVIVASRKTYGHRYVPETRQKPAQHAQKKKTSNGTFPTQESR